MNRVRIPIKKYVMDVTVSWKERYKKLEAHHNEETQWLISELNKLYEQRERDNGTQYPQGHGC